MEGVALTGQVDKVGEAANIAIKAEPNKVAPVVKQPSISV